MGTTSKIRAINCGSGKILWPRLRSLKSLLISFSERMRGKTYVKSAITLFLFKLTLIIDK